MERCAEENCLNMVYIQTRKLCATHYERIRNGSKARTSNSEEMPICSVSWCESRANSRANGSMCQAHYFAQWRGKNPEQYVPRKDSTTKRMFDKKCWVAECPKRASSHSLCKVHDRRARTGRLQVPTSLGVKLNAPCSFEGCTRPYETRKLCHSHYSQLLAGKPLAPLRDYGKYIKGEHVCAITKCNKRATNRGLCSGHSSLLRNYKIDLDRLQELLAVEQCANPGCTNTKRLHIDHDHETGAVRGMLCSGCNTSLGQLREDVARIRGLAEYKLLHS